MLVVTRKLGESVYIGRDIKVTVVRMECGQVRIGIEAPDDVRILREELLPFDAAGLEGDKADAVQ